MALTEICRNLKFLSSHFRSLICPLLYGKRYGIWRKGSKRFYQWKKLLGDLRVKPYGSERGTKIQFFFTDLQISIER